MVDLTVASMMTGLVSVSLGAPVDLIKIRLQMQTQPILSRKSEIEKTTFETTTAHVMLCVGVFFVVVLFKKCWTFPCKTRSVPCKYTIVVKIGCPNAVRFANFIIIV